MPNEQEFKPISPFDSLRDSMADTFHTAAHGKDNLATYTMVERHKELTSYAGLNFKLRIDNTMIARDLMMHAYNLFGKLGYPS